MNVQQMMQDNLLCRMLAGSHAYGTNIATSDVDYRGLFFAPPEVIRTPFFTITEATDVSEEDTKYYEINQFLKLYTAANPNIIELLFTDMAMVELTSDPYELLRANAMKLMSKKAAFTFSGYAIAQLKRIKGHNKWINTPQPEESPKQSSYLSLVHNFTDAKLFKINPMDYATDHVLVHFSSDVYGVYAYAGGSMFNKDLTLKVHPHQDTGNISITDDGTRVVPKFLVKFCKEQYKQDLETWKNYWNWKKHRNEARGTLEEQFGYDTKHAMHLVRLLNMGEEILDRGEVNVLRPDASLLLDIRNGKWTYDEVVQFAEAKDAHIREVLYKTSMLPKVPDLEYASKLLIEVQDMCWSGQINLRSPVAE